MSEVKFRWTVELPKDQDKIKAADEMSLGELLYWALFSERRVDRVPEPLRT